MLSRDQVSEFIKLCGVVKNFKDNPDLINSLSDEARKDLETLANMLSPENDYIYELAGFVDYIIKLSDSNIDQSQKLKEDNIAMTGSINHLFAIINGLNPTEGLLGADVEALQKLTSYTRNQCKNNFNKPSAWIVKGTVTLDKDYALWAESEGLAIISLYPG